MLCTLFVPFPSKFDLPYVLLFFPFSWAMGFIPFKKCLNCTLEQFYEGAEVNVFNSLCLSTRIRFPSDKLRSPCPWGLGWKCVAGSWMDEARLLRRAIILSNVSGRCYLKWWDDPGERVERDERWTKERIWGIPMFKGRQKKRELCRRTF